MTQSAYALLRKKDQQLIRKGAEDKNRQSQKDMSTYIVFD